MVAITATNSATPSLQASLGKAQLERARNEAAQAESNARDLRAQANAAEQLAQRSQENVRKAASKVQYEDATYSRPRDDNSQEVPSKVQKLIEQMYKATDEKRSLIGNSLKTNSDASAVVNSQEQQTGRIVNISA